MERRRERRTKELREKENSWEESKREMIEEAHQCLGCSFLPRTLLGLMKLLGKERQERKSQREKERFEVSNE